MSEYVVMMFFFFFQAEDGIRDLTVTGVQTCALPILITDLAILHAGLVTVPIYQTLAPDQVKYLLSHSESKVLIVDERKFLDQVLQMRQELPALRRVILIEGDDPGVEEWVISWEQALRRGDEFGRARP